MVGVTLISDRASQQRRTEDLALELVAVLLEPLPALDYVGIALLDEFELLPLLSIKLLKLSGECSLLIPGAFPALVNFFGRGFQASMLCLQLPQQVFLCSLEECLLAARKRYWAQVFIQFFGCGISGRTRRACF